MFGLKLFSFRQWDLHVSWKFNNGDRIKSSFSRYFYRWNWKVYSWKCIYIHHWCRYGYDIIACFIGPDWHLDNFVKFSKWIYPKVKFKFTMELENDSKMINASLGFNNVCEWAIFIITFITSNTTVSGPKTVVSRWVPNFLVPHAIGIASNQITYFRIVELGCSRIKMITRHIAGIRVGIAS